MNNRQQLWALYLGSLSAFGPKYDLLTIKKNKRFWRNIDKKDISKQIIYGVPAETVDDLEKTIKDRVIGFISVVCNINNRNELQRYVDQLIYNPNMELTHIIQQTKFMSFNKRETMLKEAKDKKTEGMLEKIIVNLDSVPLNNIYAFYLANAITVCRLGGLLGLLNLNEVLGKVNEIAKIAYDKYNSYDEFALGARIGYQIFKEKTLMEGKVYSFFYYNKVIIDLKCLVWNKVPWPEHISELNSLI